MLEEAGFEAVNAQDRTEQFTAILQSELETFTGMKEEFLKVTVWVSPTISCGTTYLGTRVISILVHQGKHAAYSLSEGGNIPGDVYAFIFTVS